MHPEQENFQDLRRLLALKRHEQPPPGYFENFSSQVISRIRGGEQGRDGSLAERLDAGNAWLQRFWGLLSGKPILVGAFGAAACSLILGITLFSESADNPQSTTAAASQPPPEQPVFANLVNQQSNLLLDQIPAATTGDYMPVQAKSSIFQDFRDSRQPAFDRASVTFAVPSGN
jgi:hypothetical protein